MNTARLKSAVRTVLSRVTGRIESSAKIQLIGGDVPDELTTGWQQPIVAERQEAAFADVLRDMHRGKVREDFAALANALRATNTVDPLIVEAGCGSGWNHRVLEFLLKRKLRYIGLDYSQAMVHLGKQTQPEDSFVAGDVTALPLAGASCDVLILGTVLMHVIGYKDAIQESRRVTKKWCVFHTIPVLKRRSTTVLRKEAYGVAVVEIAFNEAEFLDLVSRSGFRQRQVFQNIRHPYLDRIVGETVVARTYLCEAV